MMMMNNIQALFVFRFLTLPFPTHSQSTYYLINVDIESVTNWIDKRFLSVAIDSNSLRNKWYGFDFSSERLLNMARELVPGEIRFGGGWSDSFVFVPAATQLNQTDGSWVMTGQQFENLTTFVKKVGWDLVFAFNVRKRKHGLWDPSNAVEFLNYCTRRHIKIAGFELGNEPQHYDNLSFAIPVLPQYLASDFATLRKTISKYSMYRHNPLYGPSTSSNRPVGGGIDYLRRFLKAGGGDRIDEIAIHHYYMSSASATLKSFMSVQTFKVLVDVIEKINGFIADYAPSRRLRLTETSSTFGGGADKLSNTYVAGFLWLDKLGVAALHGLTRVCRQTFLSKRYALVNEHGYIPNPDYYLSVLYKRLVEGAVFRVTVSPNHGFLRVYAGCARTDYYRYPKGAIVVYYLNLGNQKAVLTFPQFRSQTREVFLLTPGGKGGVQSSEVKLNGNVLRLSGNAVPQMLPSHQKGGVSVQAQSFGFVVLPDVDVVACINL